MLILTQQWLFLPQTPRNLTSWFVANQGFFKSLKLPTLNLYLVLHDGCKAKEDSQKHSSRHVNSANNDLFSWQGFPHTCVITKIGNNIIKFEILVFAYPFDAISLSDSQLFLLGKTWSRLLHLILFFSKCWSHLELVWIHKYLLFYINSQVLGIRYFQRPYASYHRHIWVIS